MAERLSALRAGRPLSPREFLVLIFLRLSRPHGSAGKITSIKKGNDVIGNRTSDLPDYRMIPQPTTLHHVLAPKTGGVGGLKDVLIW
jgi:hypothetical protein